MIEYCECCKQKLKKPTRSDKQNRLYFGLWLKELSEYTGYEVDELHAMFKVKFLPQIIGQPEMREVMGALYELDYSTTQLDTKQFTDYLNRIERFANITIGITLSHPDDIYYESLGYMKTKPSNR